MRILFLFLIIVFNLPSLAQQSEQDIKKQDGYYWHSITSPVLYGNPKLDFLSSMLERYNILRQAENKDYLNDCRAELHKLQEDSRRNDFGLSKIVKLMNNFYSVKDNLDIPIVDAYCYCIKEVAGASKEELIKYKNELLERYKD